VIKLLKFDCMMRVIFIHSIITITIITIQVFYYYYVFENLAEYSRIKVIVSAIKMKTLTKERLSDSPAITSDYIPYTFDEIRGIYTKFLSSYTINVSFRSLFLFIYIHF
jgi:hypothetical protein